jgi:hypothetical protein
MCHARFGDWVIRVEEQDYSQMSRDELLATRKRLEDELEDFEEMTMFHSVNSPTHATMTERKGTSDKLQRMKDEIAGIDKLLGDAPS